MTIKLDYLTEDEELEEEQPIPNFVHSALGNRLNRFLGNYVAEKKLGEVLDSSLEYRFLEPQPGKTRKQDRQPDVSFVRKDNLPKDYEGYPDIVPDLVVEILSPTDLSYDVLKKIVEYQQAGVKLIWIVQPPIKSVVVYRLTDGTNSRGYDINGMLDGEDVIPGLKIPLTAIFDY